MAVSTQQTADVAQVLANVLGDIEGLRTAWYVSDAARPPVAVISQPSIDYADPESTFCFASYEFPVAIIVSRNQDLAAQNALSRYVSEVALVLSGATPDGVFSIEPLTARPTTVSLNGTELPAYELRVRVRA